jgi:hypothetical protein
MSAAGLLIADVGYYLLSAIADVGYLYYRRCRLLSPKSAVIAEVGYCLSPKSAIIADVRSRLLSPMSAIIAEVGYYRRSRLSISIFADVGARLVSLMPAPGYQIDCR